MSEAPGPRSSHRRCGDRLCCKRLWRGLGFQLRRPRRELESLHQKTTLTRFSDISQEEQMVEVVAQEATAIVIR